MNQIFSALEAGYSPDKILKYIQKIDPDLAIKVNTALQAGHSIEKVLSFISKNGKNVSKVLDQGKEKRGNIYQEARKSVHPALKGAGLFAGTLLAGGAGAYALSRAVPQALQGEFLQALPKPPAQAMQIGMQAAPEQITQQQQQLPFIPGQAQHITPPPSPAQAQAPISQQPIPQISPLPEALHKQASALLNAGNKPEEIENILKKLQPKIVKEYEKSTNIPIRSAIEEFSKSLPEKEQIKPMGTGMQEAPKPTENKVPESISILEEEKPKVEERKKVALPNGDIGEITNIRQGIATVNANGKEYRRKLDELEEAPEDLEEATRHLVNLIPEKEKSTAFQESIHISLPGKEGKEIPIMLTKYYGGKWAWYLDVSNDDYSKIALGTFEPKGEKKTGIGEYKPGIIDSRGAGNQQLIIQNPKYSKENKGKTWGYADTKYDMLKSIEETLKKMSKEELDEKGNIKEKRKKQTRKRPPST